jgi:hypothetical protein
VLLPREDKGDWYPMQQFGIDRLAHAMALPRSRRLALIAAGAIFFGADAHRATARRRKNGSGNRGSAKQSAFSKKCRRFTITAGPNRNDRFQHTDDDLLIEIIPKRGGAARVVFDDDNDAPNGPNGDHLGVTPFIAKVGDEVRIVARNEVVGGCELDEIWLQCVEGRGGMVKLTDRITPEECRSDADRIGVFFETTIRIKNK